MRGKTAKGRASRGATHSAAVALGRVKAQADAALAMARPTPGGG